MAHRTNDVGGIQVGPVKEPGKDLPISPGKNLALYVDKEGHFDLLGFFSDHRRKFPLPFVLAQIYALIILNEAGAERVFLQANIVLLSPQDPTLALRHMIALSSARKITKYFVYQSRT